MRITSCECHMSIQISHVLGVKCSPSCWEQKLGKGFSCQQLTIRHSEAATSSHRCEEGVRSGIVKIHLVSEATLKKSIKDFYIVGCKGLNYPYTLFSSFYTASETGEIQLFSWWTFYLIQMGQLYAHEGAEFYPSWNDWPAKVAVADWPARENKELSLWSRGGNCWERLLVKLKEKLDTGVRQQT